MASFTDGRTPNTPIEINVKFSRRDGNPLSDATLYCRLVGSLIRPAIPYTVQAVSQFVGNPHKNHLTVVHCILRSIHGPTHKGLFYLSSSPLGFRAMRILIGLLS